MALFKKTKEKKEVALEKVEKTETAEKSVKKASKKTASKEKAGTPAVTSTLVLGPRVTEKAGLLAEKNVYTFNVHVAANVQQIRDEIVRMYKVKPIKVSTVHIKAKEVFARGRRGKTRAGKKAYVFLKAGDKIEFI